MEIKIKKTITQRSYKTIEDLKNEIINSKSEEERNAKAFIYMLASFKNYKEDK